ncbi:PhzF family phenazine biosynthesis protein [Paenibacillus sp. PK4536]|uniref:PhzF family phenazine biosynthesis protein n=1 Tax=Paenibacillus sp. PK4536 TaxID=3024576 RepID=UPI0023594AF3|nr:PhzF family phenazine biosynthesis protein [Paenibacillus sp. PK4536]WIM40227.1 PhzF family phenazine biosynthesis protein [Paenibacillus sp. PK4536]
MRTIRVYHVDAFTDQPFTGNTAGVVLDAEHLSSLEMQQIARELNLSESVFLLPSDQADIDYKVRYFTPTEEIPFCGHATIGLTWLLATELGLSQQQDGVVLGTQAGAIPVVWHQQDGKIQRVEMTQVTPQIQPFTIDLTTLSAMIGVPVDAIDPAYPIQLAHTGNWHLLIPVHTQQAIDQANPDLIALSQHNRQHQIATTHLYTFTPHQEYDLYTRDFAPAIGIAEDPVTGAANGALAGFLYLNGIIPQDRTTALQIAQGHAIGRPGLLYVQAIPKGVDNPIIKVAGAATITIRGELSI